MIGFGFGIGFQRLASFVSDLLASLNWTPDANTTLEIVGDEARAVRAVGGAENPRIWKTVEVTPDQTYELAGTVNQGTANNARLRVRSGTNIAFTGDLLEVTVTGSYDATDIITPASSPISLGVVGVGGAEGTYAWINDDFSLRAITLPPDWLMASGAWNDAGAWDDTDTWNDGA